MRDEGEIPTKTEISTKTARQVPNLPEQTKTAPVLCSTRRSSKLHKTDSSRHRQKVHPKIGVPKIFGGRKNDNR